MVSDVRTGHRQLTKGIILKPKHHVVAHKTNAEDDRLKREVCSASGGLNPVESQLGLQGH